MDLVGAGSGVFGVVPTEGVGVTLAVGVLGVTGSGVGPGAVAGGRVGAAGVESGVVPGVTVMVGVGVVPVRGATHSVPRYPTVVTASVGQGGGRV